jgi:hypothetical protein
MAQPADTAPPLLVAERYAVRLTEPLEGFDGGREAFAARETGSDVLLAAVALSRARPARPKPLTLLPAAGIPDLLAPLAVGGGGEGRTFLICHAPPGLPLTARRQPWTEAELINDVLRPAARVLEALAQRNLTHRGIRPGNLYQTRPGTPVTLGEAWSAPPAALQPALFEPPYSAACHPAGRGEGSVADDIYALGVTLLVLALGAAPLAGRDDEEILRLKIEKGSYAALVGEARLPPALSDLLRGMLAEDPAHRPAPHTFFDLASARARRVAARPSRRAQKPLEFGETRIWEARGLAYFLMRHPDEGARLFHASQLDHWLRRSLGDSVLAQRLDELRRAVAAEEGPAHRREALATLRLIALLDPLAPVAWRGLVFAPDGLGGLIAEALTGAAGGGAGAEAARRLEEALDADAIGAWAALRPEPEQAASIRQEAQHLRILHRIRGLGGGLLRLLYTLNPLLPCASPLLGRRVVVRLGDLLGAIEAEVAADPGRASLLDAHLAAFIAAREEGRLGSSLAVFAGEAEVHPLLAALRAFTRLQAAFSGPPTPALAGWFASHAEPLLAEWHNRHHRERLAARLKELAPRGELAPLLALFEDRTHRLADAQGLRQAILEVGRIDAERAALARDAARRTETVRERAREVVAGLAALGFAVSLMLGLLG